MSFNKFIPDYYLLFVLTDNYISHFKYRIIMNNEMKKKVKNIIYWII